MASIGTLVSTQTIIARTAGALFGIELGSTAMTSLAAAAGSTTASQTAFLNTLYANSVGTSTPNSSVVTVVMTNLGIPTTDTAVYNGVSAYLQAQLDGASYTARGGVLNDFLTLFSTLTASPYVTAYNTKIAAAEAYAAVSTNTSNAGFDTVSSTPSTVGQTFTLTTGADSFTGSAINDTFNGVADAGTSSTFTAADILTGGSGVDTLSLVATGTANAFTLIGSNLTSIEKLQVNATATEAITFSNVSGLTDVINNASSGAVTFSGGASASSLNNVVALTVNGATAGTTLRYSDTALTGAADSQTVTLNNYGSATTAYALTINGATAAANELESLSIAATGTNNITLTTDGTQTSLKTLTVTGAGALTVGLANDNIRTSATVINASAATGGVKIGDDTGANTALGAANHSVTLGTGADSVYFGTNLNSSDTVDGGSGTDTLGVSAAVTNSIMTNVKNFEVLRLDVGNAAGTAITQDAGITSLSGFSYAVTGAGTLTLNNLANNATTTVAGGTTTLTESLKDGSGLADALTVSIQNGTNNAATTLGTLSNITGLETLNLVSGGGTGQNTITTDSITAKQVLTGSADLNFGGTAANVLAGTSTAISGTQLDASAFTGKLAVRGGNTATNIQAGTGADSITLGTGADTVNAGSGNDTITLGVQGANNTSGADVIVTGAGNDTIRFVGNTAAGTGGSTDYTAFATITDFTVGTSTGATDFLAFSGTDADFSLKSASGATTTTTGLAKGNTSQALTAADPMVVQTIAQNASATALTTNVSFFKLTTGVAFTTDVKGTFAAAIGTASVTGLGGNGNYLVSAYDTTNSKMVVAVVSAGGNADGDTTLSSADMVNADIAVVGVVNMTAADYANFGATNLAAAF